jgi:hypothetical protein
MLMAIVLSLQTIRQWLYNILAVCARRFGVSVPWQSSGFEEARGWILAASFLELVTGNKLHTPIVL